MKLGREKKGKDNSSNPRILVKVILLFLGVGLFKACSSGLRSFCMGKGGLRYPKHQTLLGNNGNGLGSFFAKRSRHFVKGLKQVTGQG